MEKLTRERRRQMTRDALLDAAAYVFARRGFHGASLDDIAEMAGFTRGAIYKNFADKEELFLAVNERFNERAIEEFAGILGEGEVWENVDLAAVSEKWREMVERDRDFYMIGLEFSLYVLRNPALRERVVEWRRKNVQRIAAFEVQQSEAAGQPLPMSAEDLANIYAITTEGFSNALMADPDTARLYEPFLRILVRGVMAIAEDESPPVPSRARPRSRSTQRSTTTR